MQIAQKECQAPQCLLDANSVKVAGCNKVCSDIIPGGGGGGTVGGSGGSGGKDGGVTTTASYQILSYQFQFQPSSIDQTPSRVTDLPAQLGTPKAIDSSGFLDAVTNTPDTILAYDLTNQPPVPVFPPKALPTTPNTLLVQDLPDELADSIVGDAVGVSVYDTSKTAVVRRKQFMLGPTVNMSLDPTVCVTDYATFLTKSPNTASVVTMSQVTAPPAPYQLSGSPRGATMTNGDTWVINATTTGSGVITRLSVPAGILINSHATAGDPIGVGGAPATTTATFPGAIVVVDAVATGTEFEEYLGGALNTTPTTFTMNADFPNAKPIKAKIFTIAGTQYAFVALLTGMNSNKVVLYDLAAKKYLPAFDVNLGTVQPLALALGIAKKTCAGVSSDDITGINQTAFLHVLVKTN